MNPETDTPGAGAQAAQRQQAITMLLRDMRARVPGAMDRLLPLVYGDLSRMAHRQLGLEPDGHTLSTTALVHEAYIRMVDQTRVQWEDRAHFFAVAAQVMRRVLVDHARRHAAERRGGPGRRAVPLDVLDSPDAGTATSEQRADILLALDAALERLARLDERQARVVECRFFAGMTEPETAQALGVATRTVTRDWLKARGWLYQELCDELG